MNNVTIYWKAVKQYFNVVLFIFLFYSVFNFGKFVRFLLGTARSKRVVVLTFIPYTQSPRVKP